MAVNIMTKLHNDLLRDIGTLARTIHYLHDLHFKELALQRGQFIFLTRICENTGINQNDLSLLLKVDKSTTAKAVQKLTAAGYINRQRSSEDQRHWQLFPTEKALLLYDQIITEENILPAVVSAKFYSVRTQRTEQAVQKKCVPIWKHTGKKQRVKNKESRCNDAAFGNYAGFNTDHGYRAGYGHGNARLRQLPVGRGLSN